MKTLLLSVVFLTAVAAVRADPVGSSIDAQITRELQSQRPLPVKKEGADQIQGKHVTYSGIIVRLFKTDHPLQLFNPAAPAEYYSGPDNVARDPVTKKACGFKIFSIGF